MVTIQDAPEPSVPIEVPESETLPPWYNFSSNKPINYAAGQLSRYFKFRQISKWDGGKFRHILIKTTKVQLEQHAQNYIPQVLAICKASSKNASSAEKRGLAAKLAAMDAFLSLASQLK